MLAHFFLLLTLTMPCLAASPRPASPAPGMLLQAAPAESQSHQEVFDWINLVILIAVLAYLLRKPIGRFFENRSAGIRKGLEEGRRALTAAENQLAAAEEKLQKLEEEIAILKDSAEREMAVERDRLRKASAEEEQRILESARSMIHSATQAAKLELRIHAARQASELAEGMLRARLNEEGQARLVTRFLQGIERPQDGKPRDLN